MHSRHSLPRLFIRLLMLLHSDRARSESGQSMMIVAFGLFGLVAFAALIIDGGNTYAQRRRAQNAADAAVLAGIRVIADKGTNSAVLSNVNSYAISKNGATRADANYVFTDNSEHAIPSDSELPPSDARAIHVITHINYNTFFAGIIGWHTAEVAADAVARFGNLGTPLGFQPLARHCNTPPPDQPIDLQALCGFDYNIPYDIWQGGQPGNLGWLSWQGPTDAGTISDELMSDITNVSYIPPSAYVPPDTHPTNDFLDGHPPCTQITPGCWIQGSTGVVNSSDVTGELDIWKSYGLQDPPKPMIIALFDNMDGTGANTNYRIIGYAAFAMTCYNLSNGGNTCGSSAKSVWGEFVKFTTPGTICDSCPDTGVYTIKMTTLPLPTE